MAKREIDFERLPSNNESVPNQKRNIEPVLEPGRVTTKSQKGGLANEIRNITNSLFSDIVLPALKNGAVDFFDHGIRMLIFGKGSSPPPGSNQHVSYNSLYRYSNQPTYKKMTYARPAASNYGQIYEDLFYETRREAEQILGLMHGRMAEYGFVSLSDLYSWVGMDNNFTMQDWGWTSLDYVGVVYTSAGYKIDLPQPVFRR